MAKTEITFVWSGVDKTGRPANGEVSATSINLAKAQLRRSGVNPKKIKKKTKPLFTLGERIKPNDIAVYTRQLATMSKAGVPMVQAMDIVSEGTDKPPMKSLANQIRNDVSGGIPIAEALAKHPLHFDDLYCSLIAAGETSGTLDIMLDRIATYREKAEAFCKFVMDQLNEETPRLYSIKRATRSVKQNSALHLLFREIAAAMNDAGYTRPHPWGKMEIPYSEVAIKEMFYVPIIDKVFKKQHSSDLNTKELSESVEYLLDAVAQNTGIAMQMPQLFNGQRTGASL